jgi:hypothetical protein
MARESSPTGIGSRVPGGFTGMRATVRKDLSIAASPSILSSSTKA